MRDGRASMRRPRSWRDAAKCSAGRGFLIYTPLSPFPAIFGFGTLCAPIIFARHDFRNTIVIVTAFFSRASCMEPSATTIQFGRELVCPTNSGHFTVSRRPRARQDTLLPTTAKPEEKGSFVSRFQEDALFSLLFQRATTP